MFALFVCLFVCFDASSCCVAFDVDGGRVRGAVLFAAAATADSTAAAATAATTAATSAVGVLSIFLFSYCCYAVDGAVDRKIVLSVFVSSSYF